MIIGFKAMPGDAILKREELRQLYKDKGEEYFLNLPIEILFGTRVFERFYRGRSDTHLQAVIKKIKNVLPKEELTISDLCGFDGISDKETILIKLGILPDLVKQKREKLKQIYEDRGEEYFLNLPIETLFGTAIGDEEDSRFKRDLEESGIDERSKIDLLIKEGQNIGICGIHKEDVYNTIGVLPELIKEKREKLRQTYEEKDLDYFLNLPAEYLSGCAIDGSFDEEDIDFHLNYNIGNCKKKLNKDNILIKDLFEDQNFVKKVLKIIKNINYNKHDKEVERQLEYIKFLKDEREKKTEYLQTMSRR